MNTSKTSDGLLLPFEVCKLQDFDVFKSLNGRLPINERPLPDELFTSWFHRLAWLNGIKSHRLTKKFWHHPGTPWGGDGDLRVAEVDLLRMADIGRVPYQLIWQTSLRSYEGIIYQNTADNPAGIRPLGGRGKQRTAHGIAFCPECLAGDQMPYFRRRWRVSYVVACMEHRRLLLDACPGCASSIMVISADEGAKSFPRYPHWTRCIRCGYDWRREGDLAESISLSDSFWQLQSQIHGAITHSWTIGPDGSEIMSLGYFQGLRYLLRALIGYQSHIKIREIVAPHFGELALPPQRSQRSSFDLLRQCDRVFLMRYLAWLLEEWPDQYIAAAIGAKLRPSYLDMYRGDIPFWLSKAFDACRSHPHYPTSNEEWESARLYLQRRGMEGNNFQVSKLVGRYWTVRRSSGTRDAANDYKLSSM
ncbi:MULTISPECIES: TniQ family protein [Deefgea]|uniref:TniQ family protein n=1 Tax=Deefgea TaxID=400947 RepID=UPI001941B8D9|nr:MULTISPECIES: TniQ family protein [Deefgea]MBM9890244.1 TniQ family protein [Deefgea sp. CFH1-16]